MVLSSRRAYVAYGLSFAVVAMAFKGNIDFLSDLNLLSMPNIVSQDEFTTPATGNYWFNGIKFTGAEPIAMPIDGVAIIPGKRPIMVLLREKNVVLQHTFFGVIRPIDRQMLARVREAAERSSLNFNKSYPSLANAAPFMIKQQIPSDALVMPALFVCFWGLLSFALYRRLLGFIR